MAEREEDKAMAGLLRRSLAQGAGPGAGEDCPGPEILAAYFDQALDAQETTRYDLHFSRCTICREQLAAMARAADASGAEEKKPVVWDWLAGPRWLMPAGALLVALLVFAGIGMRMKKIVATTNEVAMSRTDAVPLASSAPTSGYAPSAGETSPAPEAMGQASIRPAAPSQPAAVGAPAERGESAGSQALDARTVPRANSGAGAAAGRDAGSSGAAAGGMAPAEHAPIGQQQAPASQQALAQQQAITQQRVMPQQQAQTEAPRKSPGMARGALRGGSVSASGSEPVGAASADESVVVNEAAPIVDTTEAPAVAPAKKAEGRPGGTVGGIAAVVEDEAKQPSAAKTKSFAKGAAAAPARSVNAGNAVTEQATRSAALTRLQQAQISSNLVNLQIQSPDPKILWMIAGPGVIEKSEDGGTTWKPEYLEPRALLVAGAAPTAKICWVVGASATILRTTDGEHWKTIHPPAETDFVRVEATDGSTATVTAMDGRNFSTVDGGKNWSSVQ